MDQFLVTYELPRLMSPADWIVSLFKNSYSYVQCTDFSVKLVCT